METLQRTANRGSVSTGYDIDNSLKLEQGSNEWLYRASPTAGNRKTHTFSFWIKRSTLGNPTASGTMYVIGQGQHGRMHFSSDFFQYRFDDGHDVRDVTTKHRDPAAWLHVVVSVDTNQSSSSNRVKIFFNGVQTTTIDFDGGSYPDQEDTSSGWFTTSYLTIGTAPFGGSYNAGDGDYDMSGYLAEFVAIDGTAYAPTDFAEYSTDGIWIPKDISELTFGSEGFYLNFSNASNLGEDFSGNDNDFASSNLAAVDQATDTPTNNFATLNPLNVNSATASNNPTISEGATYHQSTLNDHWQPSIGTIGFTAGKWYFEGKIKNSNTNHGNISFGMGDEGDIENWGRNNDFPDASGSKSLGYIGTDTPTFDHDDIISVAVDADNGKVYFAKNNTYINSGDPAAGSNGVSIPTGGDANGTYLFGIGGYKHNNYAEIQVNFGGYTAMTISSAASDANGYGTFEYAPPSGYYALCTKNLAEYG